MARRTTTPLNGTRATPRKRRPASDEAAPKRGRLPQAAQEREGARSARQPNDAEPQTRAAGAIGGLKNAGSAVRATVAEHPVPAALIGAGLAWLLIERGAGAASSSSVLGRARETYREVADRYAEGVVKDAIADGVGRVGEKLSGAAASVRSGATRRGAAAQDRARAAGGTLREGAAAVGERARRGIESTRDGAANAWQQHPLATGLAAFATGIAVGMFLPGSRRENDIMGRKSDSLSQRIRTTSRTYYQRGREAAAYAVDALKEEAEDEGLAPTQVMRKARRIVEHVQEAAAGAARSGGSQRNGTRPRSRK